MPRNELKTESNISACKGASGSPFGGGIRVITASSISCTPIPVFPLAAIAKLLKTHFPVVLKCDIEGSERLLFQHIRDWQQRTGDTLSLDATA